MVARALVQQKNPNLRYLRPRCKYCFSLSGLYSFPSPLFRMQFFNLGNSSPTNGGATQRPPVIPLAAANAGSQQQSFADSDDHRTPPNPLDTNAVAQYQVSMGCNPRSKYCLCCGQGHGIAKLKDWVNCVGRCWRCAKSHPGRVCRTWKDQYRVSWWARHLGMSPTTLATSICPGGPYRGLPVLHDNVSFAVGQKGLDKGKEVEPQADKNEETGNDTSMTI
ncbi:hypothetical protein BDV95DRAFT_266452 [Massariosphaeria phaeospora]|uniref:Uncharacterized protein n=1 Tax=Massariosphaeria phaeospora TaxID=100035 RepID=A0A7C8M1C6_9PLEO|nr:hypothetical protein BDV95DRAFT_266452 [Massariosphaeria phaeospora]